MTPPLLRGLVDDAGLFPPTALEMDAAVARHRADLASAEPMLTHRFLCPASRIGELREHLTGADHVEVGLIADRGVSGLAETCAELGGDPRTSLALVEVPMAKVASVGDLLAVVPDGVPVFLEPPSAADVGQALDAVHAAGGERVLGAKLRCGGVRAELFPTPHEVASFIVACVAAGVPFKATAGLHHAVRHRDATTGFTHHGYLNLLLASAVAAAGGAGQDVLAALEIDDPAELAGRIAALDEQTAHRTRRAMLSYGSCSTSTPVREAGELVPTTGKDRQ
ncbi:hypothetical protein A8924_4330 [Saccharopolyspora erythraea NRRL 2338]|uniref:Uncharacterized protein n=2 Tax=Saccharopolyspora erythraea TaxID=1836 RepID=A4FGN9_SACEN|nr:hypothetical protein [Saccharopolyspora erythraea]PFG96917.1 hypothetical protein A8924_4330 [Saccharopolyspora erythraea NRRL 2338]QRK87144.1 hypothetical protein JQX30_20045 [Saccharopolyspora erythraea]CAM03214.1 hypothetical protein SACE_3943 [Saccharopolyspora erythraea NRRL 2338]